MAEGIQSFKVERFSGIGGKIFRVRRKRIQGEVETISQKGGNKIMVRWKENKGVKQKEEAFSGQMRLAGLKTS